MEGCDAGRGRHRTAAVVRAADTEAGSDFGQGRPGVCPGGVWPLGAGGAGRSCGAAGQRAVTLAVTLATTALELRVEVRGALLHVAVKDQDPDLVRFLAAKEETDRRLSLLIVDQVATTWGVRQDPAGGKTAWCALALASPDADIDGAGRGAPQAVGSTGLGLVASKLVAPASRAELIRRADLLSLLQGSLQFKLCLVEAPAGSGKTTLLAQWRAVAGGGRVAWVSLDEGDNDPTRFWAYVVAALRTVEPGVGTVALEALGGPSVELERVVVPSLVNELSRIGSPLVLVLDDHHLIANPTCHQSLTFFLDHLPTVVHLVLATRVEPPLPLARMRARGE